VRQCVLEGVSDRPMVGFIRIIRIIRIIRAGHEPATLGSWWITDLIRIRRCNPPT